MKNITTAIRLAAVQLGLVATVALADPMAALLPASGISLEFIGQGRVVTPAEVYQYGYFTHVAGVENVFSGTPNNASTAYFTFMNKLSTTRATPHGPLTIVDRKGTATIYLNPAAGANFENPASFEAGTPVLTANLRHQVILDTANGNTIFMSFDLTVISAETFTVGDQKHRLARPGQKMTWTNYGRPNTSTTQPGQFVFAGVAVSHDPAPPGLSINRPADSSALRLEVENAPGTRSVVALSPNQKDRTLLTSVDHQLAKVVMTDERTRPSKFIGTIVK
ncbi:MAG: hypothetical protein KIS67_04005 [Verrucomicrobiae bacterium]|nr:hypothetical protein [Verrucomicrobiae bacterium]